MDKLNDSVRRGFTVTELLVVILVIVLLASMVLFALASAQDDARRRRTEAQIARIHEMILEKWVSYQTRRVALRFATPPGGSIRRQASDRLNGLRELMQLEMPDRITDVLDPTPPKFLATTPALLLAYQRKAELAKRSPAGQWTAEHQGAECLYLILSRMNSGGRPALEFFSENEIGDVDGDRMPEILDGWGTPIRFLRWPAGFVSNIQTPPSPPLPGEGNDLFDPLGLHPNNYTIYPLVISAGADQLFDISFDRETAVHYKNFNIDPYTTFGGTERLGIVIDANGDGQDNSQDNIHNHNLAVN